jgi:septal ring factor EnvC (AmiA/AmiB activator)
MASSTTPLKPMAEQPLMRALAKANAFFVKALITVMFCIFSTAWWCLRQLIPSTGVAARAHTERLTQVERDLNRLIEERSSAEANDRRNEIAQLRRRTESETDTLREDVAQMRSEIASLKSSVIALRRAL